MLLLLPLHRVAPLRPAASTSRGAVDKARAGSLWSRGGGISATTASSPPPPHLRLHHRIFAFAAAASPPPGIDWTSTTGQIEGAAASDLQFQGARSISAAGGREVTAGSWRRQPQLFKKTWSCGDNAGTMWYNANQSCCSVRFTWPDSSVVRSKS
jgi:hypothetical protein